MTATDQVIHRSAQEENLTAFPIVSEDILEGTPDASIWISGQSSDKKVSQGVWQCTKGKFVWNFAWDEFVLILDGEVEIETEDGVLLTLKKGDFAHFPSGLKSRWHVPRLVKKTFVLRTSAPLEL